RGPGGVLAPVQPGSPAGIWPGGASAPGFAARPAAARGHRHDPADRAHRRGDDGKSLLRQPSRHAAPPRRGRLPARPGRAAPGVESVPGRPDPARLPHADHVPVVRSSGAGRVFDHASICKLAETKWNLPAMTYRDANAADMLDMIDLRRAAFRTPPPLAAPLLDTDPAALACDASGPGVIPPPGSVTGPAAV